MKKLTHHSKLVNDLKLQNRIFKTLLFFSLVGVILHLTEAPVLSPCPEQGCFVKTVMAKEPKSELQEIIDYIVKVFSPEGDRVVTQALSCFISESHLNPKAYNWNTNSTADVGIAQINDVHGLTVEQRQNWKFSVDYAYKLYKQQGFRPWYGSGCH